MDPRSTAADEVAWRELWAGCNSFYETVLPETVTARTWQSLLGGLADFQPIAVTNDDVAGSASAFCVRASWVVAPICYLEDLFVARIPRPRDWAGCWSPIWCSTRE